MFEIVKRLDKFIIKGYTIHALRDRHERLLRLNDNKGACVGIYVIDKGHVNGLEVHIVYNTARVLVCNICTGLICTGLFLAPEHLPRYDLHGENIIKWAEYNQVNGLNFL